MQYILYPIAILVLFAAINYLVAFLFIFKSVFRHPKYDIINSKQVPVYLEQLFKGLPRNLPPWNKLFLIRRTAVSKHFKIGSFPSQRLILLQERLPSIAERTIQNAS
ncbi:hypothetical protein CAL7102_07881 [Dulcicalothrix desertica PCC 7102]|nr:hypothetical protein CAL7102_07881 [Dulcicalothrix desertica PCC 7102]